jgi:hypothetical protein
MKDFNTLYDYITALGKVKITFYGISEKVFHFFQKCGEFERQRSIYQLGVLSSAFVGASHTRYDYIILQCALVDLIDNLYKGDLKNVVGQIKINKKSYEGNSILKTWILLSNLGHCKNTYGDEKALLNLTKRRRGFATTLLKPIEDAELLEFCKKNIDDYNFPSFHQVISIRRIYKEVKSISDRDEYLNVYKLFLLSDADDINRSKLNQLRRISETVRLLSILLLDGYYCPVPFSINIMSSLLNLIDSESSYKNKYFIDTLFPLLSYYYEKIYLDEKSQTAQRNYELQAEKHLKNLGTSYEKAIKESIKEGLVKDKTCMLMHFVRFRQTIGMQTSKNIFNEQRTINTIKKSNNSLEISIDINPITKIRTIDFYLKKDLFSIKQLGDILYSISSLVEGQIKFLLKNSLRKDISTLKNIEGKAKALGVNSEISRTLFRTGLHEYTKNTWPMIRSDIIPAFKEILWSVLRYIIKEKYTFDIESNESKYDIFTFNIPTLNVDVHKITFSRAIEEEKSDPDRVLEIKQVEKSAKRKFNGFVFTCISRIIIHDITQAPSKRIATDIDGIALKIGGKESYIEFHESKNLKRRSESEAKKDLSKNLMPIFNNFVNGKRIVPVKSYGAKLVIKL